MSQHREALKTHYDDDDPLLAVLPLIELELREKTSM